MSTTYANTSQLEQAFRSPRLRPGVLGLGAAIAGLTAVGAAAAIVLAPAAPRALPAMDATLGYAYDTRPAISRLDTSLGYADIIDTRPAVRELPAMPASLGHWDFTAPAPEVPAV